MALPEIAAVATDALKSREARSLLGTLFGNSDRKLERSDNGIWAVTGSILNQFFGLVSGALGLGQWGISTLLSWIQQGTNYIWNFNWNASDADLNQQIKSAETALAGITGAALGNLLGYTTCGLAPSAGVFVFNPALGMYLLREVGEEALQEAAGYAATIIQSTFFLASQRVFIESFKSNRAFYNLIANTAGNALDAIIPGNLSWNKYRQQRAEKGLVSFADFVEESLETLPPPLQAFFENFFEETADACWEALYVIAGSLDNWIAQQLIARDVILGPERRVEITPNRKAESEKIVLVGPENLLKNELVTTLTHYQLLDNKDIGQFVGEPAEDYALAKRLGLRVKLVLYPYPEPPFYRGQRIKPREVTINVPDIIRSKLDYLTIRAACGGSNGYMWGEFRAVAQLDNGRQMHVFGASENEAEKQLKMFLSLSDAKIRRLTISKLRNEGEDVSNPSLKRLPRRVYPGHLTIWNRTELLSTVNAGRSGVRGNFFDKNGRIIIWPESEPFGFDKVIQEVLTKGVPGLS
jgi:hypothetical protein